MSLCGKNSPLKLAPFSTFDNMPSLVEHYEYDVFISYRHNDNKYDCWVTEFVDNRQKELEATVKEKITIYFDKNPAIAAGKKSMI